MRAAVVQLDAFDACRRRDRGGVGVEHDLDALGLDRALQHARGLRVELALHQPVHQVHARVTRAPALREAIGRLEPEQAAADHDDAVAGAGALPDGRRYR